LQKKQQPAKPKPVSDGGIELSLSYQG